jgi:hypothetical protein
MLNKNEGGLTPVRASTFRPHSHCPICWGEDFVLSEEGTQVCRRCTEQPAMLVCTPIVCASS